MFHLQKNTVTGKFVMPDSVVDFHSHVGDDVDAEENKVEVCGNCLRLLIEDHNTLEDENRERVHQYNLAAVHLDLTHIEIDKALRGLRDKMKRKDLKKILKKAHEQVVPPKGHNDEVESVNGPSVSLFGFSLADLLKGL